MGAHPGPVALEADQVHRHHQLLMAFPSAPEQEDWDDDVPPVKPVAEVAEPLTRLEYLRLLRLGYIRNMHSDGMPPDLWAELEALEDERREREAEQARALDKLRREEVAALEERRRAIRERTEAPEASLEEHWHNQRQMGKTKAAEAWAAKYGVELPVIIEIAETEEEMMDAIRNLRENLARARKGPLG